VRADVLHPALLERLADVFATDRDRWLRGRRVAVDPHRPPVADADPKSFSVYGALCAVGSGGLDEGVDRLLVSASGALSARLSKLSIGA